MTSTDPADRYAVIGNPIAHSKSPIIHTLFAQQTGQHMRYDAILADRDGFEQAVNEFRQAGGRGLNITVPFKQQAWSLAQQRSARAELAGAVNTLDFSAGNCFGDNTDGVGLVNDLLLNHRLTLQGRDILVLGAGGAVRGVLAPLLEQQPGRIIIGNRTASKAVELAGLFAHLGDIDGMGLDALPEQPFDLIINGTAASLQGDVPPIPTACIGDHTCAYDMMYAAQPTAFMAWAHSQGAEKCIDGLGMLVEQAAESFYIWRKLRPETAPVIAALRAQMHDDAP
jgi:shikimate dehydrogenase